MKYNELEGLGPLPKVKNLRNPLNKEVSQFLEEAADSTPTLLSTILKCAEKINYLDPSIEFTPSSKTAELLPQLDRTQYCVRCWSPKSKSDMTPAEPFCSRASSAGPTVQQIRSNSSDYFNCDLCYACQHPSCAPPECVVNAFSLLDAM